jgi:beta-mannosidase
MDDADALSESPWQVVVGAYNGGLEKIAATSFDGKGSIESPVRLGDLSLTFEQTDASPLFITVGVLRKGELFDRTFYWTNYEARKGCLFTLPRTALSLSVSGGRASVINTGSLPAVAVNISRPGHLDSFTVSDNYFWLDPGEERTVSVSSTEGLTVGAWNAE